MDSCLVSPNVCIFQVDCYDYNNSGSHDFIGSFQTTLCQIQQASQSYAVSSISLLTSCAMKTEHNTKMLNVSLLFCFCIFFKPYMEQNLVFIPDIHLYGIYQAEFECINGKKKQNKKGYKNSGVIMIKQCKVIFSAFDFFHLEFIVILL